MRKLVLFILLFCFFSLGFSNFEKTVTVELTGKPSTGFVWTYSIEDENIINLESSKCVFENNSENKVGTNVKYIWEFKGCNAGTTKIKFEYKRHDKSESESESVKETLVYTYQVNKDKQIRLISKETINNNL